MKKAAKLLLNAVLPPKCIGCGEFTENVGALCGICWSEIHFLSEPMCNICGFPFEYEVEKDSLCGKCTQKKPVFDKARSVFLYDENSRNLVTGLKYADKTFAADSFASWIYNAGSELFDDLDIIVPVPLHRIRLFTRRYNQSALITKKLEKITNIKCVQNLLIRLKNNPPQASLSKKERLENIKGVFTVNKKHDVTGKKILLVDDVMTTGATISECTKTLKKHGASKVYVLTIARTL